MVKQLISRRIILALVAIAVVLPIAICAIVAVGGVLSASGDETGRRVLNYIALASGILWVVDLVSLVLAQGLNTLKDPDDGPGTK